MAVMDWDLWFFENVEEPFQTGGSLEPEEEEPPAVVTTPAPTDVDTSPALPSADVSNPSQQIGTPTEKLSAEEKAAEPEDKTQIERPKNYEWDFLIKPAGGLTQPPENLKSTGPWIMPPEKTGTAPQDQNQIERLPDFKWDVIRDRFPGLNQLPTDWKTTRSVELAAEKADTDPKDQNQTERLFGIDRDAVRDRNSGQTSPADWDRMFTTKEMAAEKADTTTTDASAPAAYYDWETIEQAARDYDGDVDAGLAAMVAADARAEAAASPDTDDDADYVGDALSVDASNYDARAVAAVTGEDLETIEALASIGSLHVTEEEARAIQGLEDAGTFTRDDKVAVINSDGVEYITKEEYEERQAAEAANVKPTAVDIPLAEDEFYSGWTGEGAKNSFTLKDDSQRVEGGIINSEKHPQFPMPVDEFIAMRYNDWRVADAARYELGYTYRVTSTGEVINGALLWEQLKEEGMLKDMITEDQALDIMMNALSISNNPRIGSDLLPRDAVTRGETIYQYITGYNPIPGLGEISGVVTHADMMPGFYKDYLDEDLRRMAQEAFGDEIKPRDVPVPINWCDFP